MKTQELLIKIKEKTALAAQIAVRKANAFCQSERAVRLKNALKPENLRPALLKARDFVVTFTKEQPRTAGFIYVCLFCAFSITFLDEPIARGRLALRGESFWANVAALNPSGWWFPILIVVGLAYTVAAGLSLTTESFERNMTKTKRILFVLLALSLSSLLTVFFNILVGRYTPEFLETMDLYGFSSFRFRLTETSFPSFGAQSIWAVALAAGAFCARGKNVFIGIAAVMTVALFMSAECFLSDAVMGAYIGVLMYSAACWIVSENRENSPLLTR